MINHRVITEDQRELYLYGLRLLCEKLLGIVSMFVICVLAKGVVEGAVFYLAYSFLRKYAGGYHAGSFISCYLSSCAAVLLCVVLSKTGCSQMLSLIFMITGAPVILVLAPVEHPAKPLEECEVIRYRKLTGIISVTEILIFVTFYCLGFYSLSFSVGYGFLLLSLLLVIQKLNNSRKSK